MRSFADKGFCLFQSDEFFLNPPDALAFRKADLGSPWGEPDVRVVLTQQQPILRPAGEHPVRFGATTRHQVIHHHAQISFVPP